MQDMSTVPKYKDPSCIAVIQDYYSIKTVEFSKYELYRFILQVDKTTSDRDCDHQERCYPFLHNND